MQFGKSVAVACSSFAVTNVDDLFVLVTFFAEATSSTTMTPFKIAIGQYIGFTLITVISLIGFAVAQAIPSEPIGFLGLVPILLGIWRGLDIFIMKQEEGQGEAEGEGSRAAAAKSIFKVSSITVMNGGDNIGTYIPLFSQTEGAETAIYIVIYYILLGVLLFLAFMILKQKQILRMAERYMDKLIPLLYIGLGAYILVKSSCYPWSIRHIDALASLNPGKVIMAVVTTGFLLNCIIGMAWVKLRKRAAQSAPDPDIALEEGSAPNTTSRTDPTSSTKLPRSNGEGKVPDGIAEGSPIDTAHEVVAANSNDQESAKDAVIKKSSLP